MIDLHLHTTASDGRSSPEDLVREAAAAGITTLAVTDHDTVAAVSEVATAAQAAGMAAVPGIEITAVHEGRDVHVLAYFFRQDGEEIVQFLDAQRADRRRRLFEMVDRLDRLGAPVDRGALERAAASAGRAVGRPLLAQALIKAGHAGTTNEAFERYLGEGRPGYVGRQGAAPRQVIALIARANGLTSLAHPGKLRHDEWIQGFIDDGLSAIEVRHPDHSAADEARYRQLASRCDLVVTGGSDYHGPGSGRTAGLGRVSLAPADFERLAARAGWAPHAA